MKHMPIVLDAMTPFPYTIERSATLKTATAIMYGKNIRHLPVIEEHVVVGLLSDRDIKLALSVAHGEADQDTLLVEDVCILEPYVVPHTERLDHVVEHMAAEHIGSALVTKNGKLVGIFTATDACKKLAELLKLHYPDA